MKKKSSFLIVLLSGILAASYISCKKTELVTTTTTDVNIYGYLAQNPDKFSELVKIIDKTGYSDFLNAYGAYTLFAPDNAAIKAYLQQTGKPSVDAFSVEELKNLIRLHLVQDTLNTNSFKDGKLPQVTMLGQYLLTGVTNKDGVSSYIVNRQALVIEPNIHTANGNIHVIDNVLKAATKTVAQTVKDNPAFSIFAEALDSTGFYDLLNIVNNPDTTRRFLTVIAETNKALQDSGISSYSQLKAKYSQTGDPKRSDDSLNLYVAYHIFTEARYIADIVTSASIPTLAPLEVITPKLDGETVLLNDVTFNGIHEPGVVLDRALSDITASNGVVHLANAHFAVKIRVPIRVDFDVADQPELRKLTSIFRKATSVTAIAGTGAGYSIARGFLADVTWGANTSTTSTISYNCMPATNTRYFAWWSDYIRIPMGNTSRNKWIEFRTPLLVKGKYKVWICYYRGRNSTNNPTPLSNRVSFDGEPLQRTFGFDEQKPIGTPGELEALGWKQYTEVPQTNTGEDRNNVGRLVGTVDVKSTDRHVIRIEFLLSHSGQEQNFLDMIQFIPVNDDQRKPIFGRDGSIIP